MDGDMDGNGRAGGLHGTAPGRREGRRSGLLVAVLALGVSACGGTDVSGDVVGGPPSPAA